MCWRRLGCPYRRLPTEEPSSWWTLSAAVSVDVKWKRAFKRYVNLKDLKANPKLKDMKVVQRFQRLSIQPVTKREFDIVCKMGGL